MANTTLSNLKIGALRRVHHYNSSDTALLALTGGLINDILGYFNVRLKGTIYTQDLDNTVATVASQAYVDLVDTNIIEVLQVYERTDDVKLKQISRVDYVGISPDTTQFSGNPRSWAATQALNGSGVNIWSLYLFPTPSSVLTLRYDYIKNLKFSSDTADAEFCPLPAIYDDWIYAEFKHRFWRVIAPNDTARINSALEEAKHIGAEYERAIRGPVDLTYQAQRFRTRVVMPYGFTEGSTTPP